jgi:hypothetical protein
MSDEPTAADLAAKIDAVAANIVAMRHAIVDELGKTRNDLMARMQNIRDDITVNLATADLAQKTARSALDQGGTLTDILAAMNRSLRHLQDEVGTAAKGQRMSDGTSTLGIASSSSASPLALSAA